MTRKLFVSLFLCTLATACSDGTSRDFSVASAAIESPKAGEEYLAREHHVTIDLPEEGIESAFRAVIQACNSKTEAKCTVLDSELSQSDYLSASISARMSAGSVESFVSLAANNGRIAARSTHSEDLAKPIVDSETKLAMLEAYKANLVRLRQQSRSDVDALIKIAGEIAKTQSEIETLKGEHAQLRLRVDLQTLHLNFVSARSQSFWSPIKTAFGDFGQDLGWGIAQAISGFAHLLPWLFILVPLALLFRYLWRKLR